MTIRAGLLGYGLAGRYLHAPLIEAAGMRITAVATSRGDEVAATLPRAAVVATLDALLARDDIDLVVIATPTSLHVEHATAALRSGRHVVVDKPLALTCAEVAALAALAETQQRCLVTYQNRRWDSDFLTVRKLLASGRLGEPMTFQARWDRYRPQVADRWRDRAEPGSGILHDLGPHLIDQALQLFGMPDWLQADVFAQRPHAVINDGFEILLGKGSLRMGLGVSSIAAQAGPRFRLLGSDGAFEKYGLDIQEQQLRSGARPTEAGFGEEPAAQWGVFTDGASGARESLPAERGCWTDFYRGVAAAIRDGAPPPVLIGETHQTIQLIEAALTSSREGRRITFTG